MPSGILSGPEILRQMELGKIEVDPFRPEHMNPVSLDLTLGENVAVYGGWVSTRAQRWPSSAEVLADPGIPSAVEGPDLTEDRWIATDYVMDMAREEAVVRRSMGPGGFVLVPGVLYLMHTAERVCAREHVPVLDGKSSIGRLGIMIHQTAGFGDPGFDGQFTLEVTTVHPVRVYPGVRFCQIRFHEVSGEVVSYQSERSNYCGELARGPVASRAWRMFQR